MALHANPVALHANPVAARTRIRWLHACESGGCTHANPVALHANSVALHANPTKRVT
eukprot:EC794497.1.p2 GENE.EC794497.1~~EC794497.1.p2  ORF type:complete len:57 (-),score=6.02 EC794497.1:104-274(-)